MKHIRTYLIVVTSLLVGALAMGVYVWFRLQTIETHRVVPQHVVVSESGVETVVTGTREDAVPVAALPMATSSDDAAVHNDADSESLVVQPTQLPPAQQSVLNTVGLADDAIVITPAMIACAEEALGVDRVAALAAGETPSLREGLQLIPCLE